MNISVKTKTIIFLVVFVLVSIAPQIFKSYLVHSTGSIKIIGGIMGLFIASLIYYKWKYINYLFYFIVGTALVFDLIVITHDKPKIASGFIILFLLHLGLLLYFMFSKNLKNYLST